MTAIGDLYQFSDAKTHSWLIQIGAVTLTNVEDCGWDFKVGVIPTAFIKVPGRAPAAAVYQATVTIFAGFNGVMERQFTGIVQDIDPSEQGDTIRCVGESWPLDVHYHEVVYDFNCVTAQDALEELFDDSGIASYAVSVAAWDICCVKEQVHQWETYGEAITAVGEVDGNRWYELATGTVRIDAQDPVPSASYWRTYFTGVLLPGYAMTWPTGTSEAVDGYPRIRNVGGQSRLRDCKNRVRVKGTVIDTATGDGTTTAVDITETAHATSPWVLYPNGSQAYNDMLFNSDLIDTLVKAAEVAVRLVVANNRLLMTVNVQIDGDPEMRLCRTVRIVDPTYSGINSRWYVEGYSSRMNKADFVTNLTLIGGAGAGSLVGLDPFALFSAVVEREVIGDREWATVTLDATASYDVDGTIVGYSWSDNKGVVTGTTQVVNTRIDPAAASGWEVTLVVTDNDGFTGTLTLAISVDAATNSDVFIPALFVAFGSYASASPDGAVTWFDRALAGCISAGAKAPDGVNFGIGLFGTSGGEIWRTTDYCVSALTLVVDASVTLSPITYIWWDLNTPTVVWACTLSGLLLWSWDDGAHWALYDDLGAKFGLLGTISAHRIGTPLAGGGVWVFGGTGTGWPLVVFDPVVGSHAWAGVNLGTVLNGSELASDLDGSGYPADVYCADYADMGSYAALILNSATHPTAVYGTDDIHGDGSHWRRATGLPAKTRGEWLSGDADGNQFVFAFNDNVNYLGDVTAGVMAVTPAAASLDAGDFPNFGIWLGWRVNGKAGTYIIAAEATGTTAGTIYKTWDRFTSVGKIRPATGYTAAPAGAKAKMVAMGAPALMPNVGRIAIVHDAGGATTWDISYPDPSFGSWTNVALPAQVTQERPRPVCLTPDLWFVENVSGCYDPTTFECNRELTRSPDGGATWAPTAVGDETCASLRGPNPGEINHFSRIAMDAGGRVWAARKVGRMDYDHPHSEIWYSDSQGANGTWVYSGALDHPPTGLRVPVALLCHPSNQNIIALISASYYFDSPGDKHVIVYMTENRGVTWTERGAVVGADGFALSNNCGASRFMILPNGRSVIANCEQTSSAFTIHTSDDKGATWQLRYTDDKTDNLALFTQGQWLNTGAHLVALRAPRQNGAAGDMAVMESFDSGNSWTVRTVPNPTGWAENNWDAVYDPVDDAICAYSAYFSVTRPIWRLRNATSGGVIWDDVTADWAGGVSGIHWEGMALIPR